MSLNQRQQALLNRASEKAKQARNAQVIEEWRDGKLVDVRVTEMFDREEVKRTND